MTTNNNSTSNNTAQHIIQEFLDMYPEFASQKEKISPIIEELLQRNPSVQIDETFKKDLRSQIALSLSTHSIKTSSLTSIQPTSWIRYVIPYTAGLCTAVVAGVLLMQLPMEFNKHPEIADQQISDTQELDISMDDEGSQALTVRTTSPNATQINTQEAAGSNGAKQNANPSVMGATSFDKRMAGGMGGGMMIDENYVFQGYTYTIQGDLPTWEEQLTAYKLTSPKKNLSDSVGSMIQDITNGNKNIAQNATFTSLTWETPNKYVVTLDTASNQISMYYNNNNIVTDYFSDQEPKPSTVRLDTILPTIQKFLSSNGISTEGYGNAIIIDEKGVMQTASANYTDYGYGVNANIVFPITIDNKNVIYEYGGAYGISIQYDTTNNRVSSMSMPITTQTSSFTTVSPITQQDIQERLDTMGVQSFEEDTQLPEVSVPVTFQGIEYGYYYHDQFNTSLDREPGIYFVPYIVGSVQKENLGFETDQGLYLPETIRIPLHTKVENTIMPYQR